LGSDGKKTFNRLSEYRAAIYECLDQHPSLRTNWFRLISSSQPFPPPLVAAVNEYNEDHPYTPLILTVICDKLVYNMEALKGLKSTNYTPNPRDPRLEHITDEIARALDQQLYSLGRMT
jgi:hypothetical protein